MARTLNANSLGHVVSALVLIGLFAILERQNQQERRRAAARSVHPAGWGVRDDSDEILVRLEVSVVRQRLSGEIDPATYQRRMAELATGNRSNEPVAKWRP